MTGSDMQSGESARRTGSPQMQLTRHARTRLQQRSIPRFVLQLLLDHGAREHDHRGAMIQFFDKRSRRRVAAELGHSLFRRLEPHLLDAYAVIAADGEVLTVGYRKDRIIRGARPQASRAEGRRMVRVLPAPAWAERRRKTSGASVVP